MIDERDLTYAIGTRVATHPATDEWMQGDRYGVITGYRVNAIDGGALYRVKLDSGRVKHFPPDLVEALPRYGAR